MTWRTVRVYVDVPVSGDVKEKDIVWGVQAALDAHYHRIKQRGFGAIRYGRIRAKSSTKVEAVQLRRVK